MADSATSRELSGHRCISYRHVGSGGLYGRDLEQKGPPFQVRVEGPLVFNNADQAASVRLRVCCVPITEVGNKQTDIVIA